MTRKTKYHFCMLCGALADTDSKHLSEKHAERCERLRESFDIRKLANRVEQLEERVLELETNGGD